LKLRNFQDCNEKGEKSHGELLDTIGQILERKKFAAEKEVEAGVYNNFFTIENFFMSAKLRNNLGPAN
jgi:hypothetical protein